MDADESTRSGEEKSESETVTKTREDKRKAGAVKSKKVEVSEDTLSDESGSEDARITGVLSVVKAGYSRKCMFLRLTLHPSIFLVVGSNGAILVSQVPMMTLLVVYTDE